MKDNPPKDIQEISPSNFRINIINNNNNINNNINNNNNKSFKEISELSSVVDDNKEKNKQIHPKRQMNNNIDLNFPNFSNNNFNNELNTNNTNENSVSPASTSQITTGMVSPLISYFIITSYPCKCLSAASWCLLVRFLWCMGYVSHKMNDSMCAYS